MKPHDWRRCLRRRDVRARESHRVFHRWLDGFDAVLAAAPGRRRGVLRRPEPIVLHVGGRWWASRPSTCPRDLRNKCPSVCGARRRSTTTGCWRWRVVWRRLSGPHLTNPASALLRGRRISDHPSMKRAKRHAPPQPPAVRNPVARFAAARQRRPRQEQRRESRQAYRLVSSSVTHSDGDSTRFAAATRIGWMRKLPGRGGRQGHALDDLQLSSR